MAFFPDWLHDSYILRGPGNPLAAGPVEGIPAFYCALKVISDAFASLRCEVTDRQDNPVEHWVADAWNYRPNSYHTPVAIKRAIVRAMIVHGEAFCEIDLANREIHYLPHYAVSVDDTNYRNFTYTINTTNGPETRPSEKILHFVGCPTETGRRGIGVITKARLALESAAQQQTYGNSIWKNLIRPFVVLKNKGRLSDKAKANWKEYFQKKQGGSENAGGGLLLEEGLDAEFINISPADTQFLEQQRFTVEEICRLMGGLPPPYVSDLGRATWANLAELGNVFAHQVVQPHCQSVEEENELKMFGSNEPLQVKFRLTDLVRGSLSANATAVSQLKAAGVASNNELRRVLELPRSTNPSDDQLLQPLNIQQGDVGGTPEPTE